MGVGEGVGEAASLVERRGMDDRLTVFRTGAGVGRVETEVVGGGGSFFGGAAQPNSMAP